MTTSALPVGTEVLNFGVLCSTILGDGRKRTTFLFQDVWNICFMLLYLHKKINIYLSFLPQMLLHLRLHVLHKVEYRLKLIYINTQRL